MVACKLFHKIHDAAPQLGFLICMNAFVSVSPSPVARKSFT
jgi:hypothetical protein